MPVFTYEARDVAGRTQAGQQEAASAAVLASELRNRGWLVLGVKPAAAGGGGSTAWLSARSVDVEVSFQQLASMLRSGMTLLESLRTVADQAERRAMAQIWRAVSERIQEGSNLADALARHRCFPDLSVQLVRVGEMTGNLDVVLLRAAEVMERRRTLRNSVMTSLAYPTIVFLAAIGTSLYMVFGVIPKLARFLASSNRPLPAMTQMLVDVSNFLVDYALAVGVGQAVLAVALVLTYRWPPGRMFLDTLLLRLPVLGRLFRLGASALFARSLALLVSSGVTLNDALRTVEQLFRNRYVAERVAEARSTVLRGGTLADGLNDRLAFMPMLPRMVAVGEATGALDEVLEENARFSEDQLARMIRWLAVVVEPVILLTVGGIVGFVYISFFMALFGATTGVR